VRGDPDRREGSGQASGGATSDEPASTTSAPQRDAGGTYTLLVDLPATTTVTVGALGTHRLSAGAYAYTGSALGPGGFARVTRHRRTACNDHDVRHWHIDSLLGDTSATIDRVYYAPGADVECAVADRLPAGPVDGFGASDCGCGSHLAGPEPIESLRERARRAYDAEAATIDALIDER
jgi:endonuclease-3